ncbi:NADPH-dependent FMN reductase [Listeria costaricensis]|uniref:NADPH-dependent FMN reductase n=1 Tax=Listeria costaricensis TaxID=2026604 RepID=UPI000C083EBC|nr:NAD(P)H-dependent oxidoreductase [Listeria costaricensis]
MTKVGMIVGSLRKESYSKKVAKLLAELLPEDFEAVFIPLDELAIYNQDFDDEGNVPAAWTQFREQAKQLDAVIFVTPEYNRSVPAVLKNALDIGSRPYGHSVWDQKPAAVVSVSPGKLSGFGANHHLRQSLVFLNMPIMQQPEAYIGEIGQLLDETGRYQNPEQTQAFFQTIVDGFVNWTKQNLSK